jgi:hypothetical protein
VVARLRQLDRIGARFSLDDGSGPHSLEASNNFMDWLSLTLSDLSLLRSHFPDPLYWLRLGVFSNESECVSQMATIAFVSQTFSTLGSSLRTPTPQEYGVAGVWCKEVLLRYLTLSVHGAPLVGTDCSIIF